MEASNGSIEQSYKLPNSLIDACVVYGLDEQPSETLQSRFSKSKDLCADLAGTEVEPQVLSIITATQWAKTKSEFIAAERSISLPGDIIPALHHSFFLDGAVIAAPDQVPIAVLISTEKKINDICAYCTGFSFSRPFTVVQNNDGTFGFSPQANSGDTSVEEEDKNIIYLPTCIALVSRSPLFHVQKEILSWFFQKFSDVDNTQFLNAVESFARQLFMIPVPPHGRIAIEFHLFGHTTCLNPPISEFGHLDTRLNYPFLSLSIDNVFEVMSALLTEQRILFTCTSHTVLAYNIECFLLYIAPFEWCHTCIPILPEHEFEIFKSNTIFIVGCGKKYLNSNLIDNAKNLVIVDLDDDQVHYRNFTGAKFGGQCVPALPKHRIDDFKEHYSKLPQHYDLSMVDRLVQVSPKDRIYDRRQFEYQTDFKLLALLQYFIAVMFDEVIHLPGSNTVQECGTYLSAAPYERRFYDLFCNTKMFAKAYTRRRNKALHDSFTRLCDVHRRSRHKGFSVDTDNLFNASSSPIARRRRFGSQKLQQLAKDNLVQSERHFSMPLGAKRLDTPRERSSTEADDVYLPGIGVHHILTLPSLSETKEKYYEAMMLELSRLIEGSKNPIESSLIAPALYLRACANLAAGRCIQGFDDFETLSKHSVQLLPDIRMIREITALMSTKDRAVLKTKPYWSMFSTKHLIKQSLQNRADQQIADLEVCVPTKSLTKEQFVATMQHNRIISDADTAIRVFHALRQDKTGKVEPEELEVFYDAWKSVLNVNKHAQMLAGFKGVESILVYYNDSKVITSEGDGHLILTSYRLLVKVASSVNMICDLKLPEWKLVKCNASVEKRLRPAVSFESTNSETSSSPYAVFGDTSTRDFWYRLIKELRASLQLVIIKRNVDIMQQAETNIMLFNAIFHSPLQCRSAILKDPSIILQLSTKDVTLEDTTSCDHSYKLLQRINPSKDESSKATISCALYIPSGLGSQEHSGKLWLGLGNGLLKVYTMGYQLHSDQLAHKITGVSQSKGARLSFFLLVYDTVWATANRSIIIIDADTSSALI
ncbi:DENN domain-containing protein 3-like isoform X2 [Dysidea avara]|uniref:DENN domain-containing protein 3-like isoform X2 n=1 Tax=Dysidea avara TaxID=196820 RepID=UPI00331A8CE8